MLLIANDDIHAGELLDRRQCLERDITCLQDKLSRLPETFEKSLIPMTRLYQEILQQRLSALHELD
jgi:hypothetical protein